MIRLPLSSPLLQPLLEGLPILLLSLAAGCHPAPAAADPLASPPVAGYPALAGPYDRSGLAARYTERTTAHCGFFVRVRPCLRYGGLGEGHRKMRRFSVPVRQPLFSPSPDAWRLQVAVNPLITEVTTMANHATRPSATRHRSVRLTAIILLSLKPGVRTGTAEIHQRLTEAGIPVSLRAVQRYLNTLAETLPIEGDGQSPQGWRWIKAPDVVSLVERAGGAA